MSGGGEFSTDFQVPILGTPSLFLSSTTSGAAIDISSGAVPAGFSWVVEGVDMFGTSTGPFQAELVWGLAGGDYFGGDARLLPTGQSAAGISWRGAVPFGPGQAVHVLASVSGAASFLTASAWGRILPYPY